MDHLIKGDDSMQGKRKHHSAEFKAKVALAALTGAKTLAELASEYKIHPTMITRWKQELVENAADLFGKGKKKEASQEATVAELYRQIGQLKVENDFLSKLPGLNLTGRRNGK
jgi:transposase-like protein